MAVSLRYLLALLAEGQASGEVTANEFLLVLETVKCGKVLSRSVSAQPGSPTNGDLYIIPAGATGAAWSGNGNKFGLYYSGWKIFPFADGDIVRIVDENALFSYSAAESLWFPVQPIRSATEHWTGEYRGGSKVYAKTFTFSSVASGLTAQAHGISSIVFTAAKAPMHEASIVNNGLAFAALGPITDLGVAVVGFVVDATNITLDYMGQPPANTDVVVRLTYCKT